MSDSIENPVAGTGAHSHAVPAVVGRVVEIRDGNHNGTSVWRRASDLRPYCFASHDTGEVMDAERCLLVRDLDVEIIPSGYPYGCDLSTPDGLVLLGIDSAEDPTDLDWLEGSEILWDSALEAEYEAAAHSVLDGEAFGNPIEIVRLVQRAKAGKESK